MDDISRKEAEACDTTPFCNTFLIVVFLFHVFSSCVYSLLFNLPSSSLTPLLERPNDFHDCQATIRAKKQQNSHTNIIPSRLFSFFGRQIQATPESSSSLVSHVKSRLIASVLGPPLEQHRLRAFFTPHPQAAQVRVTRRPGHVPAWYSRAFLESCRKGIRLGAVCLHCTLLVDDLC